MVDSGGCKNGVNSLFAVSHNFKIHDCDKYDLSAVAISATGASVQFKQYILVKMQIEEQQMDVISSTSWILYQEHSYLGSLGWLSLEGSWMLEKDR